jgi:hypothetical protein
VPSRFSHVEFHLRNIIQIKEIGLPMANMKPGDLPFSFYRRMAYFWVCFSNFHSRKQCPVQGELQTSCGESGFLQPVKMFLQTCRVVVNARPMWWAYFFHLIEVEVVSLI